MADRGDGNARPAGEGARSTGGVSTQALFHPCRRRHCAGQWLMTRYFPSKVGLTPGNMLWVWPMPYGPMDTRPTQKVPVRIGDAERDRAIATLGDHFAAGRLTADEFEQRMDQALKARFNSDLEPLFADLPRTVQPTVEPKSNPRNDVHLA